MKKIFFTIHCFLLIACGNETTQNNCFTSIRVNEIIDLSLPEFINLQVDVGNAKTTLSQSGRTVIIIKRSSNNYKVFDLECPDKNCSSLMTFDGLKLKCPCNQKEYSSLNGAPTNSKGCFALEYNVVQTSSSNLQITR